MSDNKFDKGLKTLSESVKQLETKLQTVENVASTGLLVTRSKIEDILVDKDKRQKSQQLDAIHDIILRKAMDESKRDFNVCVDKLVYYVEEYAPRISELVGFALLGELKYELVFRLAISLFKDVSTEILGSCIESSHKKQFSKTKNSDGTTSYDYKAMMSMVDEYDSSKNSKEPKEPKEPKKKKKLSFR